MGDAETTGASVPADKQGSAEAPKPKRARKSGAPRVLPRVRALIRLPDGNYHLLNEPTFAEVDEGYKWRREKGEAGEVYAIGRLSIERVAEAEVVTVKRSTSAV